MHSCGGYFWQRVLGHWNHRRIRFAGTEIKRKGTCGAEKYKGRIGTGLWERIPGGVGAKKEKINEEVQTERRAYDKLYKCNLS